MQIALRSKQKAEGGRQADAEAMRLCRRTVRKGYAFPSGTNYEVGEAGPRQSFGGVASKNIFLAPTERRSLSALCGGKAATARSSESIGLFEPARSFESARLLSAFCRVPSAFRFLPSALRLLPSALCLLLTAHCSLLTVSGQFTQSQGNSPLYSARPYEARAPNGLPRALDGVGIDQKLNEQLPLDLTLTDESGKNVKLGDYFGKKPVVLSLVYYQCPMLCNQILNGMVTAFKVMNFKPGEEFEVVTVSFDPRENAALAAAKKNTYVNYLPEARRAGAAAGWHFLTADEATIKRITESVGFRYHWDAATNQFAHASAIYVATPEGKLARYFYGIEYAPRDLRLGLIEAADNKIGTPVDQLLLYCYHYDPATGKYGARVMRLMQAGGMATLIGVVVMLFALRRRSATAMHLGAET